jgi:uncharacterized membrane protein
MLGTALLLIATPLLRFATDWTWITSGLLAWCVATTVFIGLAGWRLLGHEPADLRRNADLLDPTASVILASAAAVAVASLAAVVLELSGTRCDPSQACMPAFQRDAHVALTAATIISSWFFVQMIFAVHYTHLFYGSDEDETEPRGGLDFAGRDEPLFADFVYFTVSVGATSQTSDTAVSSPVMRQVVTAHAIFAFFFNTTILALSINIAAGLLG